MLIAKTNPTETLREHTMELMDRYEVLKDTYEQTINQPQVWDLLRLAVLYHDTGKANSHFQYTLNKKISVGTEKPQINHIPHNFLSPYFLPLDKLKLNKHHRRILIEAIAYHHARDFYLDTVQLQSIAQTDIIHYFYKVSQELEIDIPTDGRFFSKISDDLNMRRTKHTFDDERYITYVLVKGLLHRLDHAASGHVDIELDQDFDLSKLTKNYIREITNKQTGFLRSLQKYTLQNQDKNLILVAQTGLGKTEAALLWAGKKKLFFTVPLRVSLNALYDRVAREMDYKNCGLLHSSSAHHLNENGSEDWEVIYDQSTHFANKIIFTTIDQILKFPFKYQGYEKQYATLAHSCIVIDEIQAYNPWIVAVIIKAIQMIHDIGGKFMIMTATLPEIYLQTLEDFNVIDESSSVEEFYDDAFLRHRYTLESQSIVDNIKMIENSGYNRKVLIIANTVDQAIEIYEKLSKTPLNVYLLHARFLQNDRQVLESELKQFDKDNRAGVWITTQIVEASIDIDFDELHTELAPLDSLFQRFGRCYRKRKLDKDNFNIFIYTDEISGRGTVYDKDILDISSDYLKEHITQHGHKILESQKMQMVKSLYSKEELEGTKFYKEFQQALIELEQIEDHSYSYQEAQAQLRGDHSVMVIPRQIYDTIIHLFEKLEVEVSKEKRTEIRRKIEGFTCSVGKYKYRNDLFPIDHYRKTPSGKYPLMRHVYILEKNYDFDREKIAGIGIIDEELGFEVI